MKRFILCFSFFVLIPATAVGVQVATQGKPLGTQENRITESKGSLRAENPATSKKDQDSANHVTVTVNNQAAPLYTKPDGKEAKQNAANERMQIAIAISTGLLVLVGFLTCGVIAWQSWETRRSIEVQIAKERARIRVKVDDLKLVLRQTGRFNAVNCTLINSGPTEGFVDDFRAKLIRVPHKTISVSYDECRRWSISDPIPAKSQMNKSAVIVLEPEMFLEDKDVISINKSESFIHFYGIVKYHDMFDRKRQSTIHLRWTMLWGGAIKGQIMESWQPDGKDEENQDT